MKKTLILYSSVDGQTKKICDYICQSIKVDDDTIVDLARLEDFILTADIRDNVDAVVTKNNSTQQLHDYDNVLIGASIRYGKHRKNLVTFINDNKTTLTEKNTAFFSVNLVARKPEKNTAATNLYLTKFLTETEWQPTLVDVFAGKLDYAMYGLFDGLMIKFIMWMTKGPTSSDEPIEFTDWTRVDKFVEKITLL